MVKKYTPHLAAPVGKPGAPVKTAAGSKRIKPGDGHAPAGKTVKAYKTMGMEAKAALKTGVLSPEDMKKVKRVNRMRKAAGTI